ncbi:glutathione S-transferase N-terminal domain-containing protein [Novosphingobium sp. JCM 18896]|uniref:glutathione S-transferase N-terminal domain-containing protein n=1 Tax=Novosphingobium sp. JCM 18896 TaxID=2989731 RepID=UPI002223249E|nr:glutathione S-transferase N-terminal domain-containing protein [Novosphingobium sp. JCM 18896]MCW1432274.1 glutathione S-transferase N-terminal domain-containing protein [Novosphingobium sp. JCM 18896]
MIDLHFSPTPNGQKITIALEELGLSHRLIAYDIFAGDQHSSELGAINPNHKLPAIVDHEPSFGGAPHAVFESAAILQYLAEKTGKLLPKSPRARSDALQWLIWQAACLGPMSGQASHFIRYAPVHIDYAIERYSREQARLLAVLERRLAKSEFIGGEEYSIADIAIWPSRAAAADMGFDMTAYPHTGRWLLAIGQRPAVQRGRTAERAMPEKYSRARVDLTSGEWNHMFSPRAGENPAFLNSGNEISTSVDTSAGPKSQENQ